MGQYNLLTLWRLVLRLWDSRQFKAVPSTEKSGTKLVHSCYGNHMRSNLGPTLLSVWKKTWLIWIPVSGSLVTWRPDVGNEGPPFKSFECLDRCFCSIYHQHWILTSVKWSTWIVPKSRESRTTKFFIVPWHVRVMSWKSPSTSLNNSLILCSKYFLRTCALNSEKLSKPTEVFARLLETV